MVEGENKKKRVSCVEVLCSGTVLGGLCKVRQVWARCHFQLCCRFSSHKHCAATCRPILLPSMVYISIIVQIVMCFVFETLSRFSCGSFLKHCPDFHTVCSWNVVLNSYGLYLKQYTDFPVVCKIFETLSRFSDNLYLKHCPEFIGLYVKKCSDFPVVCKVFETYSRFSCGLYWKHCPDVRTVYSWNVVQNSYGSYLKYNTDFPVVCKIF